MAHYKRGKCRYCGRNRRSSETFYRKRHGLRPIKIPDRGRGHRYSTPEWHAAWDAWRAMMDLAWPDEFNMMSNWPRSWDIVHHTRPRRAREKRLTKAIVAGKLDPDNVAWPLSKKPHIYYW